VIEAKFKGICGTFQELMEGYCEFKQAVAFRDNHTTAMEVCKGSSKPQMLAWGRHIMQIFVEWMYTKSEGKENVQAIRYSINNAYSTWFESILSGKLPPPPPPPQPEDGNEMSDDDDAVDIDGDGVGDVVYENVDEVEEADEEGEADE
jgi:hypothetical protein